MGKRGGNKKANSSCFASNLSLREEVNGKKQSNVNPKSMLKLDHLKNLASWATSEACVPPLAAFFGQRLAASAEALGVPPDPSLFICQRCESILRPGYNCTVRIEKNMCKMRRRKKCGIPSQNNVCYNCQFCGYKNSIRGTPKGHMQVICPQKVKPPSKPNLAKSQDQKSQKQKNIKRTVPDADRDDGKGKNVDAQLDVTDVPATNGNEIEVNSSDAPIDMIAIPDAGINDNEASCPVTPSVKPNISLLDSKRRKRNRSAGVKRTDSNSICASADVEQETNAPSKRKRKGWTSLKEIVESNDKDAGINRANLTIPFFI